MLAAIAVIASKNPCDVPKLLLASDKEFKGPGSGPRSTWITAMRKWRSDCKAAINYTGQIYEVDALKWTQSAYMQPQMHPYDRLFYDEVSGTYTVDKWMDDLSSRYGGIDSVLVWPTCERAACSNIACMRCSCPACGHQLRTKPRRLLRGASYH